MFKNFIARWRQRARYGGKSNQVIFNEIYSKKRWKGSGEISSGLGSQPENSAQYEDFIVDYVTKHGIKSIVDIGCGDFQVSKRILERLPGDIDYTGVDVSQVAIDHNQARYKAPRIRFVCADATADPLPEGELVLVREVLQHLANTYILHILPKLRAFPHALSTNTERIDAKRINVDIATGSGSRAGLGGGLWLDLPPFECRLEEVLRVRHKDHPTEMVTVRLLAGKD